MAGAGAQSTADNYTGDNLTTKYTYEQTATCEDRNRLKDKPSFEKVTITRSYQDTDAINAKYKIILRRNLKSYCDNNTTTSDIDGTLAITGAGGNGRHCKRCKTPKHLQKQTELL